MKIHQEGQGVTGGDKGGDRNQQALPTMWTKVPPATFVKNALHERSPRAVDVKTPPNQSLSSLSNQGNSVKCVGLIPELY